MDLSERGERLSFAYFTPMTETCWGTESGELTNPNKSSTFSLRQPCRAVFVGIFSEKRAKN